MCGRGLTFNAIVWLFFGNKKNIYIECKKYRREDKECMGKRQRAVKMTDR
jgi:hypothetical protein